MTIKHQTPLDSLYVSQPRRWLIVILAAYLVMGILFAALTPAWQAPDEPAHYNYIAYVAMQHQLPVLQMGDYNQDELEQLKRESFPPELSIEGVRYENYQPPLYYVLSAVVFVLTQGSLFFLRLFNVLLGLVSLLLLYRSLEVVFPNKPMITLSATAFAALLPMHVAVAASLSNDVLAELLVNAAFLVLLTWMKSFYEEQAGDTQTVHAQTDWRTLLCLGIICGLGLLTKIYGYVLLPIVVITIIGVLWRRRAKFIAGIRQALWVAVPALLMGLPIWIRNSYLYGPWDLLGLNWHDQVVVGQTTLTEFLAKNGWVAYSERAFNFTFRSFWGVFGWLGVFMDERIYTACLIFSGVIFFGLLWAIVRFISGKPDTDMSDFQIAVLSLFALMALAVFASYVWYNLKFVQHQGRYFFWGILPISTAVALGWREVLQPLQGLITGALGFVLAGSLVVSGLLIGNIDSWTVLMIGLISGLLILQPILNASYKSLYPQSRGFWQRSLGNPLFATTTGLLRWLVWATPFLLLILLNLVAPFLYILPQLASH